MSSESKMSFAILSSAREIIIQLHKYRLLNQLDRFERNFKLDTGWKLQNCSGFFNSGLKEAIFRFSGIDSVNSDRLIIALKTGTSSVATSHYDCW